VNPRTELEKRYPLADFTEYFSFLAEHVTEKSLNTNEHHICPRKQFPDFAQGFPENTVTLRARDHVIAHLLLSDVVPEMLYGSAWEEQRREAAARGGRTSGPITGKLCKERKTGIFSPGVQARGARASGLLHKEKSIGIFAPKYRGAGGRASGQAVGRIVGRRHKENGTGIFAKGMQAKGGLYGTHKRWHVARHIIKAECALCQQS